MSPVLQFPNGNQGVVILALTRSKPSQSCFRYPSMTCFLVMNLFPLPKRSKQRKQKSCAIWCSACLIVWLFCYAFSHFLVKPNPTILLKWFHCMPTLITRWYKWFTPVSLPWLRFLGLHIGAPSMGKLTVVKGQGTTLPWAHCVCNLVYPVESSALPRCFSTRYPFDERVLAYVFFELVIVNYRPILIEGRAGLEASFPSSHTMIVLCIMATAIMQFPYYLKNHSVRLWANLPKLALTIRTLSSWTTLNSYCFNKQKPLEP